MLSGFFVLLCCARCTASRLNILDLQLPCIIRIAPSSGGLQFTAAQNNPWLIFSSPSCCCPVWAHTHPQLSPPVNKLSWSAFNCSQEARINKNRGHLKDDIWQEKCPNRKYFIFPLQMVFPTWGTIHLATSIPLSWKGQRLWMLCLTLKSSG